ncbi:25606_t:CDS:2, partial [Gigaspora rosea]
IGIKFGTFPLIANYAGKLWQQMDKSKKSCETLITHLRFYKEQEQYINRKPNFYAAPYRISIKLFSITPSSANCERIFSLLGWIYGNKRTQLELD